MADQAIYQLTTSSRFMLLFAAISIIMNNELLIAGVDPGLASGGLVLLSSVGPEVRAAVSLVEKKSQREAAQQRAGDLAAELDGWSDREFASAALRAENWRDSFAQAVDQLIAEQGPIDYFAVESFVDQRSRAREEQQRLVRNRWQTPLVIGMLAVVLEQRGITVGNQRLIYQNAGIVIRQWSAELSELKDRRRGQSDLFVSGDRQISNDHQRKAWAHAMALRLRLSQTENGAK
jgi:hypothetical protein